MNKSIQKFTKRSHLALTTLIFVGVLVTGKFLIHQSSLEFLTVNTLFTSAIAGTVFIIGFLLAGVFADYKEAEKVPAELSSSLESIWDEARVFKQRNTKFDSQKIRNTLIEIVKRFRKGLEHEGDHSNLRPAIDAVDTLTDSFAKMESLGMPPNYVVRLKTEQANIRKQILRVYHIQKMQFIPSVFVLAESIVAFVLFLLLFIKTEGSPESFIIFAFISYLFLYAVRLIRVLEKPFRKGHGSHDDVSIFLIREFEEELQSI